MTSKYMWVNLTAEKNLRINNQISYLKSKKEITTSQHRCIKNKSCQTSLISFCERAIVHVDREKNSVFCVLTLKRLRQTFMGLFHGFTKRILYKISGRSGYKIIFKTSLKEFHQCCIIPQNGRRGAQRVLLWI